MVIERDGSRCQVAMEIVDMALTSASTRGVRLRLPPLRTIQPFSRGKARRWCLIYPLTNQTE